MLASLRALYPWLRHVFADGGYAGDKLHEAIAALGRWAIEISKRWDAAKGFKVLKCRCVVEVSFPQLTKVDVLTLEAGRQHVPDFNLVVRDDDTVNQQQHELPRLLEGGIRQPLLHLFEASRGMQTSGH